MSTDKIGRNNPTEVPPKDAKAELTEEELVKVSAGSLSMSFSRFHVVYKAQTSY